MGNTTFSGPVRSEGGFEQITKNASTGAITATNFDVDTSGNITAAGTATITGKIVSQLKPSLFGLTAAAFATGASKTYVANQIHICNYTGAAAQAGTLPAATAGTIVVHAQSVDTAGGTNTLSFDCAGSDSFETGSIIESRGSSAVTFDTSTAGETLLTFTPADAGTNLFSIGSYLYFTCVTAGKWHVSYDFQHLGAGTTGTFAFGA